METPCKDVEHCAKMDTIQNKQSQHSQEITCLCAECERLQFHIKHLEGRVSHLEQSLDQLEDENRRNNLLFYGIPKEHKESQYDCEQEVLCVIHGEMGIVKDVPLEKAFRRGASIVVRFTSQKDRDLVLSYVGRLHGSQYSVREDVSPLVRLKQKGLLPLYKELRGRKEKVNIFQDRLVCGDGVFTYDLKTRKIVRLCDGRRTHGKQTDNGRTYRKLSSNIATYRNLPGTSGICRNLTDSSSGIYSNDSAGIYRKLTDSAGIDRKLTDSDGIDRKLTNNDETDRKLTDSDGTNRNLTNSDGINLKINDSDGTNRKLTDSDGTDRKLESQQGTSIGHQHVFTQGYHSQPSLSKPSDLFSMKVDFKSENFIASSEVIHSEKSVDAGENKQSRERLHNGSIQISESDSSKPDSQSSEKFLPQSQDVGHKCDKMTVPEEKNEQEKERTEEQSKQDRGPSLELARSPNFTSLIQKFSGFFSDIAAERKKQKLAQNPNALMGHGVLAPEDKGTRVLSEHEQQCSEKSGTAVRDAHNGLKSTSVDCTERVAVECRSRVTSGYDSPLMSPSGESHPDTQERSANASDDFKENARTDLHNQERLTTAPADFGENASTDCHRRVRASSKGSAASSADCKEAISVECQEHAVNSEMSSLMSPLGSSIRTDVSGDLDSGLSTLTASLASQSSDLWQLTQILQAALDDEELIEYGQQDIDEALKPLTMDMITPPDTSRLFADSWLVEHSMQGGELFNQHEDLELPEPPEFEDYAKCMDQLDFPDPPEDLTLPVPPEAPVSPEKLNRKDEICSTREKSMERIPEQLSYPTQRGSKSIVATSWFHCKESHVSNEGLKPASVAQNFEQDKPREDCSVLAEDAPSRSFEIPPRSFKSKLASSSPRAIPVDLNLSLTLTADADNSTASGTLTPRSTENVCVLSDSYSDEDNIYLENSYMEFERRRVKSSSDEFCYSPRNSIEDHSRGCQRDSSKQLHTVSLQKQVHQQSASDGSRHSRQSLAESSGKGKGKGSRRHRSTSSSRRSSASDHSHKAPASHRSLSAVGSSSRQLTKTGKRLERTISDSLRTQAQNRSGGEFCKRHNSAKAPKQKSAKAASSPRHNSVKVASNPGPNSAKVASSPRHNSVKVASSPRHNSTKVSSSPRHNSGKMASSPRHNSAKNASSPRESETPRGGSYSDIPALFSRHDEICGTVRVQRSQSAGRTSSPSPSETPRERSRRGGTSFLSGSLSRSDCQEWNQSDISFASPRIVSKEREAVACSSTPRSKIAARLAFSSGNTPRRDDSFCYTPRKEDEPFCYTPRKPEEPFCYTPRSLSCSNTPRRDTSNRCRETLRLNITEVVQERLRSRIASRDQERSNTPSDTKSNEKFTHSSIKTERDCENIDTPRNTQIRIPSSTELRTLEANDTSRSAQISTTPEANGTSENKPSASLQPSASRASRCDIAKSEGHREPRGVQTSIQRTQSVDRSSRARARRRSSLFADVCSLLKDEHTFRRIKSRSVPRQGEREVGWHRSGGQWQYCHKRSVADQGQHIANQGNASNPNPNPNPMEGNGAVRKSSSPMEVCSNGQNLGPVESGDGDGPGAHGNPIARSSRDAHAQEQDHISMRLNEMQDSILAPIKEDLSEWITRIVGVDINPDSFIEVLDSGVVLCSIAKLIEKHAQQYAKEGKLNEPLPNYRLKCNTRAKSGTWFSRDNVTGFLGWCKAYGMADETMFDSEDLVSHKHEKPVVNCVLELARLGWKFGIEPPNLIRMEREIEEEVFLPPPPPPPFIPKPVEVVEVPVVVEKPVEKPVEKKPDKVDLHKEVRRVAQKCKCQEYVNRISEGVYDVFGKRVFIRLLHGKHLMVRVGGGWDTFENYLMHHDPVQVFEFHREGSRENVNKPPATKNNFEGYLVIKSKYKS